jgi:hypothetical protein
LLAAAAGKNAGATVMTAGRDGARVVPAGAREHGCEAHPEVMLQISWREAGKMVGRGNQDGFRLRFLFGIIALLQFRRCVK